MTISPIAGGLESAVACAEVKSPRPAELPLPPRFVVKELRGTQRREAAIYRHLWRDVARPPAARMLGTDCGDDADYLFLEEVGAMSAWPWADTDVAAAACRVLAKLHASPKPAERVFSEWDYERELQQSAEATLAMAATALNGSGARCWSRLGDLRRVVFALPAIRARLLAAGVTFIHGDVHPGNVIARRHDDRNEIVLIDWARARIGSPLEDLASWLHSLGCWEPEARRRHDSLLRAYLHARDPGATMNADLRRRYCFASAANGLAGAIRYHLSLLGDPLSSDVTRANSHRALPAWERVIRRAAALL